LIVLKNENISQIIQAVIQAVTDIAFRFQHHLANGQITSANHVQSFALELYNIKQYANQELEAVHTDFNSPSSKRYFISPSNFKLHTFHHHISFQDFVQLTNFPMFPF
jgi:hypothetical protein